MNFIDQVNADYEKILRKSDSAAQLKWLISGMGAAQMNMIDPKDHVVKPFPTFLKPYFVDMAHREKIALATKTVIKAVEKVGKAYIEDEQNFDGLFDLREEDPSGRLFELSKVNPLYPNYQVMVRLDCFMDPHTGDMKFLEFNCGDPSGMGWNDAMLDIFLGLSAVKELGKKYKLHDDHLLATHHKTLLKKYAEYCKAKKATPKKKPFFAITMWKGSTVLSDDLLIVNYAREHGYGSDLVDPAEFTYDGKELRIGPTDQVVDIIYRDAITDFVKDQFWPHCKDTVIQAYKDGNVCFVNPIRAATGDFKTMPAVVTDKRYEKLFTPAERKILDECVPWTRLFRQYKTDFHGKEVDLVEHVRKNKDDFVLKPNVGYGGFGIALGRMKTQKEWDEAVNKALEGKYAVQQFVTVPTDKFPIFEGDTLKGFEDKNVNINFWAHGGEFVGAFNRGSSSLIINVHQGGGLVPVLFVEPK